MIVMHKFLMKKIPHVPCPLASVRLTNKKTIERTFNFVPTHSHVTSANTFLFSILCLGCTCDK